MKTFLYLLLASIEIVSKVEFQRKFEMGSTLAGKADGEDVVWTLDNI